MVGGWIVWWASLLYYVLLYCCKWVGASVRCCGVLLSCGYHCCTINTYCCTAVVQGCGWVDRFVPVVLLGCVSTGSWAILIFVFFLRLYRPRSCIVPHHFCCTVVLLLYFYRTHILGCLLYTSPSPRDATLSRMPSSA